MGDAAGHLAERAQPLLLHDCALAHLQVVVGLLERVVQLRLVGGERNVIAQLPQELAFCAAERVGRVPRDHQYAKHTTALLDHQRHDYHRAQTSFREALREREANFGDVRLVHQFACDAARESVLIDLDSRLFGHRQLERQRSAARADAAHGQDAGVMLVVAQRGEVRGQVFFDAAHHHLENAFEVLALGDGACDALEQRQPLELHQCAPLGDLARMRLGAQTGVGRLERRGALGDARFQRLVAGLQFAFGASCVATCRTYPSA